MGKKRPVCFRKAFFSGSGSFTFRAMAVYSGYIPQHMKNSIPFICLVMIFTACNKNAPPNPSGSGKPHKMALVIGNPIDYGMGDLLMFPIGANYNPKIEKKVEEPNAEKDKTSLLNFSKNDNGFVENRQAFYDASASKEYVNPNEEDFDIRNILFYRKASGTSHILSGDTLHILSFAIHNEFKNPLILYRVVKMDINKDGKYNSLDAVMLYVSALDGSTLTQVTPPDEQFFDYFYYPEAQSILIKTAFDIDGDSRFTELDETNFREMRLDQPAMGKEIFAKSLKDSLKGQVSVLK